MSRTKPTEAQVLELRAHAEALKQFFDEHGNVPIHDPLDMLDWAWMLEDIESYIAHEINPEPYPNLDE